MFRFLWSHTLPNVFVVVELFYKERAIVEESGCEGYKTVWFCGKQRVKKEKECLHNGYTSGNLKVEFGNSAELWRSYLDNGRIICSVTTDSLKQLTLYNSPNYICTGKLGGGGRGVETGRKKKLQNKKALFSRLWNMFFSHQI